MNPVEPKNLRIYRFHPSGLDPVSVYVEQFSPNASRITVQCYARAWTAYWGSHGDQPVEHFVVNCHADYVIDNLIWGMQGIVLAKMQKHEIAYLTKIVEAIQVHFKGVLS